MVGTACEDIDAIVDYGIPELADPYGPWGTWSSIKPEGPLSFRTLGAFCFFYTGKNGEKNATNIRLTAKLRRKGLIWVSHLYIKEREGAFYGFK